jgi:phospholipase D1/2
VRADQERQHREEPPQIGRATCRAVHTQSGRPWAPWSPVSRPLRTDIAWTIRDTIFSAHRFIYIENQYLRSHRVVGWLLEQAQTYRDLEIIILLPLLPEGMFTEQPNRATKQGHHLQATGLRRLTDALGARVGLFTLLRNGPAPSDKPDVACLYGSDLIYVHAKVLIADDREALIGSANLNERSLQTDTETGLHWRSPTAVSGLRQRLWCHHFDLPAEQDWGAGPYLPRWREIAEANAKLPPGQRQGFVVPMPESAIDHQAESSLLVPTKNV